MYQVSIPFKREGTWKVVFLAVVAVLAIVVFQFPSNGKAHGKQEIARIVRNPVPSFQFPSNGKAHGKRPYFRPRRAVAPNTPKPNTNCAGLFSHENSPSKSQKPLWPLNQTRFVNKISLEASLHLCSWTNYAVLVSDP